MPPRKRALAHETVAGRKAERARLGRLRDLKVGVHARQRYYKAVGLFLQTLGAWHIPLAATFEELDRQLEEYIDMLWSEGMSKDLAADTLSGTQHFLSVRKKFHAGWRMLTVWQQRELPRRAPPMLPEVCMACAGLCFREQLPGLGLLFLLGFHCMLRTVECFTARASQVMVGATSGVFALPMTKSGLRKGAQELVTIDDPAVLFLCRWLLQHRLPGDSISELSLAQTRTFFKRCIAELRLEKLGLTPYSIRRGGASYDFRAHGDINRTVFRGRWDSVRTARIYVVDGTASLAEQQLDANDWCRVNSAIRHLKVAS